MNVLVINAGSSSLKYQLIDTKTESDIAKGIVERIGMDGSKLTQKVAGRDNFVIMHDMETHIDAMKALVTALTGEASAVIDSMASIDAVGHRVVHGGERFSSSVIIDEDVMSAIRENIPLAPLHNPANIQGIEACQSLMPGVPQVAVFDTAFHQSMPSYAYMYGLPYEIYKELRVRRYGFHGTSHRFVAARTAELLGKDISEAKIITCHLGNGSSISAVKYGKSIDTTMGLTPLEGVMMGTRSGSIDPAIIEFLMSQKGMTISEVTSMMNKQSGIEGVSGVSSDMRDIQDAVLEHNDRAELALDMLCYGIKKYIGSYAAAMNGVDAVAFTGGIGENDWIVRERVMKDMDFFGIKIDEEKNQRDNRKESDLTVPGYKTKVFIVCTNEELAIARDTVALLK